MSRSRLWEPIVYKGETLRAKILLKSPSGSSINLSGCNLETLPATNNPLSASISNPTNGEITAVIDASSISPGFYPYELSIIWSNGDKEKILMGQIHIKEGYVRD